MWLHLTNQSVNLDFIVRVTRNGTSVFLGFDDPMKESLRLEGRDAEIAQDVLSDSGKRLDGCWLCLPDDENSPLSV